MNQLSYPNKCVVIRAGVTYTGKQGPQYTPGVTAQDVGSRNLWFGRVLIPPGGRTRAHRHDAHESAAYVLKGDLAMFHGPELRERDSAGPGDFVFIPAGVPHVVVDIDSLRVRDAQTRGEPVLYGDATSREILRRARVPESSQVVVLLNDPDAIARAVRVARELARDVPILARTRYLAEIAPLQRAGATEVVAQEFEASLDVVARVLRASSVPRNVIGERMEQARRRGPASEHRAPLAGRGLGEVSELAELKVESFLVGQPSWIGGRTLAASRLREHTGATLVAIGRQGGTATHAAPSDTIHAGDILYLVGDVPQVTAALHLLEMGPDPPPGPPTGQD